MTTTQSDLLRDVSPGRLRPLNQTEAKSTLADLKQIAGAEPVVADLLAGESPLRDFVVAALALSPHLREIANLEPRLLVAAIEKPLSPQIEALVEAARRAWLPAEGEDASPSESEVMSRLRIAKRRASFLVALADLARIYDGKVTTRWLSRLAEASISAAIDHLLLSAHEAGKIVIPDPAAPSQRSGLIVLGMGKLGAEELNYSSDIDLVVFFDEMAGIVPDPDDAIDIFPRLMRRLVRILQERTADGYVFRTDLRLRPDPGSTPLAIPVDAAMIYYEGRGQNWERAAFIKARPVGGDIAAGQAFIRDLVPFVFRKYLDYAAIADIHSIKRQIHVHKGHGAIAVKGHNVKLGRGGIREIEFFVQTQQLIAGGRMPALRSRSTEQTLSELTEAKWIDAETRDELTAAYWFLRDVEHRIQMVRDEQTHLLPETDAELRRIAYMMGFADVPSFSEALVATLKTVERRYARLFEQETKLSSETGNLVFTGQGDDPDTLETLRRLGFERPSDIANVIRTWHYGRYRATQSVEARERLTELTPELLRVFGESKRADKALLRFDSFISGLPAGIQLFSLLSTNPALLSLIVNIMSSAPRLAEIIAAKPHVFDGMLDPRLMAELPTRDYLAERLKSFLAPARHYEETLDLLRIFASEQRFLIGIRLLTGAIGGIMAARAFTFLADLIVEAALDAVMQEIRAAHGEYPGGRVAVVGMGKLGSFELSAGSDIDIILLYDYDDAAGESSGPKPLDAMRYFTRITQRLIAALSAPTAEGVLYEVDMRLRPSGNKGPVATRINSFEKYQREEAWTWEHMALSRARLICGDEELVNDAERVIGEVLSTKRDVTKIAKDVREMRALIEQEKPAESIWDLKLIPGGLIDIEFIAQYLRLIAPVRGVGIDANGLSTAEALKLLGGSLMDRNDLDVCLKALHLYTEVSQLIRLCIDGTFDPKNTPSGLIELVCRAGDCPDIRTLEAELKRLSKAVRKVFQATVGS
ncbi:MULTISPECIES: bifunctional [glutamine synthetase] adenylyltransferase/[glutamine synthetase]-adenylyl-L-tyrosine phosphorylase [unclassified Rhizobium]|jgi:glutamate-ammonia-ligase adenylyltransferase|uniref:bifunctional [glutamine synthetase] adenylyltransferase/[glutamine synthetase]-adenylyl-L-tyrosine phosphorylase n=1 Tax=unclassified Rhizobium TaxID=2613769 RepID=UPI000649291C|nr:MULTISPECIES: bifunctional [glutamine synthetase] adenylyltransferase/[glutamine synthetase]-adenylyl-L-tyrosine phosphorylase [unclassified Rhizobium]MBN8951124.1 bifunctional [glutamine synthetase] adenylyltransferase/[glutamine synthetase]-adenylyl-L-tyrosine phosphorylase [Rhizobium tropici]OJY69132.1 MAG: glutamine-synthetase adenylyltransferase [Rhizobium sp. 60-20]RKD73994.1 glutamate-ammonia-ligase adenylyltransferase [Rhizobium sp. WW_1]